MDIALEKTLASLKKVARDSSVAAVVLSNVFTGILAWAFEWSFAEVVWVYWGQSLVSVITHWMLIRTLKGFRVDSIKAGINPLKEDDPSSRNRAARSFLFSFIFIHGLYAWMLWYPLDQKLRFEEIGDALLFLLGITGFLVANAISFVVESRTIFRIKRPLLDSLLTYPMLRFLPIHIAIAVALAFDARTGLLLPFMAFKTIADAGLHMIEHTLFRRM